MLNRIDDKIKEATRILRKLGYESAPVYAREFYNYMTAETPTGDAITINDVLENEFLMVHEVVEISELKKMSTPINQQTIMRFYPKIYKAHFTAMEYELTHAVNKKDYEWLKRRFLSPKFFLSQLDDPNLPPEFDYLRQKMATRCKSMIEKFSKHLSQA